MNEYITCFTMHGEAKQINKNALTFRPAAYALVIHEDKLLMTVVRSTGKYTLPGGGIDTGERMEEALKRELKEECGIEIEIIAPAFFKETFFYYEPLDRAWQCHSFCFLCKPLTFDLTDDLNEEEDESIEPQWVDIKSLTPDNIQICGEEILKYIKTQGNCD